MSPLNLADSVSLASCGPKGPSLSFPVTLYSPYACDLSVLHLRICLSNSQIFDYFADAKITSCLSSPYLVESIGIFNPGRPIPCAPPHTQQQCPARCVRAASSVDLCHICSLPWRKMTHECGRCTAAYPRGSNMPGTNTRLRSELMFILVI